MDYRFFESIERDETAREAITLKKYIVNPDRNEEKTGHTVIRKPGDAIVAYFYVDGHYQTNDRLTDEQLHSINNAVKALILLKGEECIDVHIFAKFIKKAAGVNIKNVTIDKALKTYYYSFRLAGKYKSDEIDLISPLNKTV